MSRNTCGFLAFVCLAFAFPCALNLLFGGEPYSPFALSPLIQPYAWQCFGILSVAGFILIVWWAQALECELGVFVLIGFVTGVFAASLWFLKASSTSMPTRDANVLWLAAGMLAFMSMSAWATYLVRMIANAVPGVRPTRSDR